MTRISDPAVPGSQKLALIEGATNEDATALDGFTAALRDNQMAPLEFSVTNIATSEREPGAVVADVTITPADAERPGGAAAGPPAAPFSFPMEFQTADTG
ncbi:MAG: hypothetical protein K0R68_4081, partial [Mycobacterium sp.]|nr:hypothetical protein [Mycobacterium sp.]